MSSALSLLPPGRGGRASRVGGRPVGLGLPLSTGSRRREEARPRGPACCWMGGLAGGSGQNFLQMALRKAGGCERLLDTSSELPGGCGCAWGHAAARRAGLQLSALAAAMAAFRPPLQPGFPPFPPCLLCLSLGAPGRSRSLLSITSHLSPAHPRASIERGRLCDHRAPVPIPHLRPFPAGLGCTGQQSRGYFYYRITTCLYGAPCCRRATHRGSQRAAVLRGHCLAPHGGDSTGKGVLRSFLRAFSSGALHGKRAPGRLRAALT